MTRKQFETLRREIEKQEFSVAFEGDAFSFALKRAEFKKGQLQKLLSAASRVKESKTIQSKAERYQRLLQKLEGRTLQFQVLKQDYTQQRALGG